MFKKRATRDDIQQMHETKFTECINSMDILQAKQHSPNCLLRDPIDRFWVGRMGIKSQKSSKYTAMEETVILVAVDDTPHSSKALRWALENLSACRSPNARLVLVHAEPVGQVYAVPGDGLLAGYYVSPDMISAIRQHEETVTASVFQEAKRICKEYGVSPKTVVSPGDARDGICDAAEKENADILVMGSHGYGALKRAFLGSVSDYCVHHVKCPVVVVKPDHS